MADSSEEHQQQTLTTKDCMHKTKTIQFLGRTTPIVLQNDNGPCPLLAICNVLLLRNNLNLSPDIGEVSQEKLLSLVAERLIDSNSNVNMQNKDAGYVENQQQNIADAIDLLPRLTTGIDVNLKFRRIDDFEFTPECAIFDLLDIPLYHGWIVDPQDIDTTKAIGSKSYNALMGELVALESIRGDCKSNTEEDAVDFAAATTAALGVPSPCLSKAKSFGDSPRSVSDQKSMRKGDLEEEEEIMKALKLSETDLPTSLVASPNETVNGAVTLPADSDTYSNNEVVLNPIPMSGKDIGVEDPSCYQPEPSISDKSSILNSDKSDKQSADIKLDQSSDNKSGGLIAATNSVETAVDVENADSHSLVKSTDSKVERRSDICLEGEMIDNQSTQSTSGEDVHEAANIQCGCGTPQMSNPSVLADSSSGRTQGTDVPEIYTSSVDDSEPIYEGEECILDTVAVAYEDREPVYEGEVILAEQADKTASDPCNVKPVDEITPQQAELIRNFFRSNASQLTFYGLFSLQDGLKERELCVFFRNNHFSTMFKLDGELYLLATDQGYINQPDLVWEKLNEVNGDTLFMTSNFKEFKLESHSNESWDEHGAMTSTADYLASIDTAAQAGLDINSDLQLAIALQQQEFEQQPPCSNVQQPQSNNEGSRLITGPQVPRTGGRSSSSTSKPESKSKDKCNIM